MAAELTIPDDGFLTLTIGPVTREVDLYRLNNLIAEARQQTDGSAVAQQAAMVRVLEAEGFPGVSYRAATALANKLAEAIETLGKV